MFSIVASTTIDGGGVSQYMSTLKKMGREEENDIALLHRPMVSRESR